MEESSVIRTVRVTGFSGHDHVRIEVYDQQGIMIGILRPLIEDLIPLITQLAPDRIQIAEEVNRYLGHEVCFPVEITIIR